MTLLWFLVLGQIPLYGASKLATADPIEGFRSVIASNKGTLAEFGILPLFTAELFFILLSQFQLIVPNKYSADEKNLFAAA
jgi:preprotein translocase subunit SecY